jgi:hypothetical protein
MANYQITPFPHANAQGILITWTGPGAPPPGMKVQIMAQVQPGMHWFGAYVANSPLPGSGGEWRGWTAANPAMNTNQMFQVPINLSAGPVAVYPTYGVVGVPTSHYYTDQQIAPDKTNSVFTIPIAGDVSNITIQVIGGGGGIK